MKGVILAGGTGSRLAPMTNVTNKHLLPVYDQPMIYYPIQTLVKAGITDIMIITGSEHAGAFMNLLKDGSEFGAKFTFRCQVNADGIAGALSLCEDFVGNDKVAVILGDNIFDDSIIPSIEEAKENDRSFIFLQQVDDPTRFGIATLNQKGQVEKIVEKPEKPESNLCVTGLYIYKSEVFNFIRRIKPSDRGELEITDVNNWFVNRGVMEGREITGFWSDAGTIESLYKATNKMREIRG